MPVGVDRRARARGDLGRRSTCTRALGAMSAPCRSSDSERSPASASSVARLAQVHADRCRGRDRSRTALETSSVTTSPGRMDARLDDPDDLALGDRVVVLLLGGRVDVEPDVRRARDLGLVDGSSPDIRAARRPTRRGSRLTPSKDVAARRSGRCRPRPPHEMTASFGDRRRRTARPGPRRRSCRARLERRGRLGERHARRASGRSIGFGPEARR